MTIVLLLCASLRAAQQITVRTTAPDRVLRVAQGSDLRAKTLEELSKAADVIALGQIGEHRFINYGTPDAYLDWTEHRFFVADLVKADARTTSTWLTIPVLQEGGVRTDSGSPLKIEVIEFPPLREGGTYLLFLRWSDILQAYLPVQAQFGAVEIRDGYAWALSQSTAPRGTPVGEFLQSLRLIQMAAGAKAPPVTWPVTWTADLGLASLQHVGAALMAPKYGVGESGLTLFKDTGTDPSQWPSRTVTSCRAFFDASDAGYFAYERGPSTRR